jgi:hypothetical protein
MQDFLQDTDDCNEDAMGDVEEQIHYVTAVHVSFDADRSLG